MKLDIRYTVCREVTQQRRDEALGSRTGTRNESVTAFFVLNDGNGMAVWITGQSDI